MRHPNIFPAAILYHIRRAFGFRRRDPRLSKRTHQMYGAIMRGVYKGPSKVGPAIRRFVRSLREDAKRAGIHPSE